MGEKRSNHTVYNVNYHFVWCPKYRYAILEPIEDSLESSFRDVCDEYGYEILSWFERPEVFRHHERRIRAFRSTAWVPGPQLHEGFQCFADVSLDLFSEQCRGVGAEILSGKQTHLQV